MTHLTDSQLRSYLDNELQSEHVDSCSQCQSRLKAIQLQRDRLHQHLDSLLPTSEPAPQNALTKFTRYQSRKENETMFNKIFAPKFRPLWMGASALALALALLAFTPAREAFSAFLSLFRVQQIAVVSFNPANLPRNFNNNSQKTERLMSDMLKTEKNGEVKSVASAAEAASVAGFAVRLPSSLSSPKISVQPSNRMIATIDLQRINTLLDAAEVKDVKLPANLNGATITIETPKSVTTTYGTCPEPQPSTDTPRRPPSAEDFKSCVAITQMPSPVVTANPSNIDPKPLGEAFLRVLGLSAGDAKAFSDRIDWATTLVIPVPTNNASSKDVNVDGAKGTLVTQNDSKSYALIWVKNNVLYGIMGYGDEAAALAIANSLK